MGHLRSLSCSVVALTMLVFAAGCGEAGGPASDGRLHDEVRTNGQQLRPTDPSDPFGYEGASVQSYVSDGGGFRVWWASEGRHAVPAGDENGNDVPDYVEMVGEIADDVAVHLRENDWRLAMADDLGPGDAPGGDGRFDIYLIDFSAGDGNYSRDFCIENFDGVDECAGHFRLENDFAGLNYPSQAYAVRLVLSHEYFHAVQAAYIGELPQWWSEGTATWFEEYYDPEQQDFERLTSLYFDEHDRTLNDRGRGPTDGFAYGASIFVYFIELYGGERDIRTIFERMSRGVELMPALKDEMRASFGSLNQAFGFFATLNLFTGSRAISEGGYPAADRFAGVQVDARDIDAPVNWNVDADPLAARYLELRFDEAISLRKTALEGFANQPDLVAVNRSEFAETGAFELIQSGDATRFDPGMSPLFIVVSNGFTDERRATTLQVRLPGPEDVEPDPTDDGDGAGAGGETESEGGCHTTGVEQGPGSLWLVLVIGIWAVRRGSRRSRV